MQFHWIQEWDGTWDRVTWWHTRNPKVLGPDLVTMLYTDGTRHVVTLAYFRSIQRGRFDPNVRNVH